MKRLYACILGILISSLIFAPAFSEQRKVTQPDVEWGKATDNVTSGGGHVGGKIPKYWDNNAFTDNLTLYGNDIITRGPGVDVRAHGAVGDGVTDDTAAIQAAMNVPNTVGGSVAHSILFPAGKYLITSTLSITYHHTKFRGAGRQNTFLKIGTGVTAFSPPAGSIGRNGIEFHDMDFSSASGTPDAYAFTAPDNTVSSQVGLSLYIYRCEFHSLLNVYNPETESRNIAFTGSIFEDVTFTNTPLKMHGLKDKNVVHFNRCIWTGLTQDTAATWIGGGTSDAFGVYFNNCRWDVVDREALRFSGASAKIAYVSIRDCYFEATYYDGGAGSAIRFDNVVQFLLLENVYTTDSGKIAAGRPFIGGASYASPIVFINTHIGQHDDVDPTMAALAAVSLTYLGMSNRHDAGVNANRHNWFGELFTANKGIAVGGTTGNYLTQVIYDNTLVGLGFGTTAANSCEDNTVTGALPIPLAADSQTVMLGVPNASASIARTFFTAWITGTTGQVTVRRCNLDNVATTATSGNFTIRLLK